MLLRRTGFNGVVYYASPLLEGAGVRHGFATRVGGVSARPFDSLNLGNPSGCDRQDEDSCIQENYRRLQRAIGCGDCSRAWVHQVHGAMVENVGGSGFENGRKADGLVTNNPRQVLAIRVADCVPILITNVSGSHVAAVHAGWRGVIAEIISGAIEQLRAIGAGEKFVAAVGPCIGVDAFEVGPEVVAEFRRVFGDEAPVRESTGGKGHVDLVRACRIQLERNGIAAEAIDTTDRCTFRDADEFFSHRRESGITGRMAALISPRGG